MRLDEFGYAELRPYFNTLTDDIAAVDSELVNQWDARRRLALMERRRQLQSEQRRVEQRMHALTADAPASGNGRIMEYDELTKTLYEIKADVAILKSQLSDHLTRCGGEATRLPFNVLAFLAVGGIVTLLLLAFIVIRIGL